MSKLGNLLALLATILILFGCNKEPMVSDLRLEADKTEILSDGQEIATLSVKDQKGQDCTDKVHFKVNGKDWTTPKFSTDQEGVYTIVAYLGDIKSNEVRITASRKSEQNLRLEVDRETIFVDGVDRVSFRCYDITKPEGSLFYDATYYVNGTPIKGDSYLPEAEGRYKVVAKVDNRISQEIEVEAKNEFKPIARLLIENYTATWCPTCPKAHEILNTLLNESFRYVPLVIHTQDKLSCPLGERLMEQRGYQKMPTFDGNRKEELPYTIGEIKEKLANTTTPVGIALSVDLEGDQISAHITVRRDPAWAEQGVRILVAAYENGIKEAQTHEGGVVDKHAIHNYVLRSFFESKYQGSAFSFDANNQYKRHITLVPLKGTRPENYGIMVAVVSQAGVVLNSQYANVGQSRGY